MPKDYGFGLPIENWFKTPNVLIPYLEILHPHKAALWVLIYIIRYTWGYHRETVPLTVDEFVNGKKDKDGNRLDAGTCLGERTVERSLELLFELGMINVEVDDSQANKIKKYYSVRTTAGCHGDTPRDVMVTPLTASNDTPEAGSDSSKDNIKKIEDDSNESSSASSNSVSTSSRSTKQRQPYTGRPVKLNPDGVYFWFGVKRGNAYLNPVLYAGRALPDDHDDKIVRPYKGARSLQTTHDGYTLRTIGVMTMLSMVLFGNTVNNLDNDVELSDALNNRVRYEVLQHMETKNKSAYEWLMNLNPNIILQWSKTFSEAKYIPKVWTKLYTALLKFERDYLDVPDVDEDQIIYTSSESSDMDFPISNIYGDND